MLHAVADLRDLRVPRSNRLEKLRGAREGQHSIRVNDQYRICFTWRSGMRIKWKLSIIIVDEVK